MRSSLRILFLLPLISFTFIILAPSCRTKAPTVAPVPETVVMAEPPDAPSPPDLVTEPPQSLAVDSLECRVMVQFISTGGGINGQARLDLERYQMKFSSEENLPIQPRRIPRGREGEVEYCYPLYGFSAEQATRFVEGLRRALTDQPLVIISENTRQSLR
ncbi:MAG TPA: hypothetical protein P5550_06385 [Bacteroidales bacterium]|nr:hypothetical protein [Bacteroidales bacterium]HRZ77269.1 hypothetical protein [Bacteroidales bacterium]